MADKRGKVQKIKIAGFKSIREQEVDLGDINILIGPNGVGKTNFIGVFKLLNKIIDKDLQSHVSQSGGADSFLHFGAKNTQEILISLRFFPNNYACHLVPTDRDDLIFKREIVRFRNGHEKNIDLHNTGPETQLFDFDADICQHVRDYMHNWKVYHFHDTSSSAQIKRTQDVADSHPLMADASNLAPFLLALKESRSKGDRKAYDKIVRTIQGAAPFFQDFILEPERQNEDKIRLRWKQKGSDHPFYSSDLSDGTLRFICLATLLLQPEPPNVILLDEPELGLHPHAIHILGGLFRKAARKCQVIASTQSVTLANQFSYEDVIVTDRNNGESVFRRLEEGEISQWIEEYGIGDLWEKNLLGGTPK